MNGPPAENSGSGSWTSMNEWVGGNGLDQSIRRVKS